MADTQLGHVNGQVSKKGAILVPDCLSRILHANFLTPKPCARVG